MDWVQKDHEPTRNTINPHRLLQSSNLVGEPGGWYEKVSALNSDEPGFGSSPSLLLTAWGVVLEPAVHHLQNKVCTHLRAVFMWRLLKKPWKQISPRKRRGCWRDGGATVPGRVPVTGNIQQSLGIVSGVFFKMWCLGPAGPAQNPFETLRWKDWLSTQGGALKVPPHFSIWTTQSLLFLPHQRRARPVLGQFLQKFEWCLL